MVTIRNGLGTGGESVVFSLPHGYPAFPYGNVFDKVYYSQPVGGSSGEDGNHFVNVPVAEGMALPMMERVTGISDRGELIGPFSAIAPKPEDGSPNLVVKSPDMASNSRAKPPLADSRELLRGAGFRNRLGTKSD